MKTNIYPKKPGQFLILFLAIIIASARISINMSKSLGYSSMTSITELQEDEYESGIDVPPGKAVAIWQRYNRFVLLPGKKKSLPSQFCLM